MGFKAVVIGVSSGGLEALKVLVPGLRSDFALPVLIVQHLAAHADSYLPVCLNALSPLTVKEAEDKESLRPGVVYVAPPDYHLLVEGDSHLEPQRGHQSEFFEAIRGCALRDRVRCLRAGARRDRPDRSQP